MQRLAFGVMLASLFLLPVLPASAATSNPKTFKIMGVHLGMSPAEARKALSTEAIGNVVSDNKDCFGETTSDDLGHCTSIVAADLSKQGGGERHIQLTFTEDFPAHRHVSRATEILFSQVIPNGSFTEESYQKYLKAVEARFGKPTLTPAQQFTNFNADLTYASWCDGDPCKVVNGNLVGLRADLNFNKTTPLTAFIELNDYAFAESRQAAVLKAQASGVKASF